MATQLLTGFLFDYVGAFGLEAVAPSARRLVGVTLAAASAVAYQIAPFTVVEHDQSTMAATRLV